MDDATRQSILADLKEAVKKDRIAAAVRSAIQNRSANVGIPDGTNDAAAVAQCLVNNGIGLDELGLQ